MILHPLQQIFSKAIDFNEKALMIFRFQYQNNALYKRFVDELNCDAASVQSVEEIPFLPISFFKTNKLVSANFKAEQVFESSGTTGSLPSRHYVKDLAIYEESFIKGFENFYGPIKDYCILGLLPSYLERGGSSLVYMVQKMMEISGHENNGFYLSNFQQLARTLNELENKGQKTLLIGVTYALLDFAEAFPLPLQHTLVMETGGMKGRKKELLRSEVHQLLKSAFNLHAIHSEYGMTELLSQAYSAGDGIFRSPNWLKVLVREEDDPLKLHASSQHSVTGVINIVDLANYYSCSFIATDDIGRLLPNGSFEVLGRLDHSDIRGCSLLAL